MVGINAYRQQPPLQGAVNDARDIEQALRAAGVREVTVLLDQAATRAAVKASWERLAQQARPGDTVVLTYAGHGAREPERLPGSEPGGHEKVLVLGDFSPDQPSGSGERIPYNELKQWLAAAPQLNLIVVADACYAGELTRDLDPRARLLGPRTIGDYGPIAAETLPSPGAPVPPSRLTHVTFLAASQEHEKINEVQIGGQPRGALSWAFAQALRGAADQNRDGELSRGELRQFVTEAVRTYTESRQHPRLEPSADTERRILPAAALVAAAPAFEPLRLRLLGESDSTSSTLTRELRGIVPATGQPDLIWDQVTREVLSAQGDVVARLREATPAAVQPVIDKWAFLNAAKQWSLTQPLSLRLEPNDRLHRRGERLTVILNDPRYPYLTVFNLAADGALNFLYPRAGDALTIATQQPFRLGNIMVTPPFGADHVLAIVTPQPLTTLHGRLREMHNRPAAATLASLLQEQLKGSYQLGVLGLYTAP